MKDITIDEVFIDYSKIGTNDYRGIAYFWNMEYKHKLREFSNENRIKVHNQLLSENLPLNGISDRHYEIILKYQS